MLGPIVMRSLLIGLEKSMSEQVLTVEQRGETTKVLRLNRPDRANAINEELTRRLTEEIGECYSDQTKLLILEGEGKHFCSGFDRPSSSQEAQANPNVLGVKVEAMMQILAGAPCVTLVHSHGAAVGAGAEIVVACDYRCATEDAMFMVPGFRLMGVSLGNSRLSQCIGPDQAMKMILQAEKIDCAKALELGLVTDLVQTDALDEFVTQLEQALETTSKSALSSIKTSVHQTNSRKSGSYAFEGPAYNASV